MDSTHRWDPADGAAPWEPVPIQEAPYGYFADLCSRYSLAATPGVQAASSDEDFNLPDDDLPLPPTQKEGPVVVVPEQLNYYTICLNSAITSHRVTMKKGSINYECYGSIARSWYDSLDGGRTIRDRYGAFEDAEGNGESGYLCEVKNAAPQ